VQRAGTLKRKLDHTVSARRNKRSKLLSVSGDGGLCEDCQSIDFSAICDIDAVTLQDATRDGILVANLEDRPLRGSESFCALCRLFFRMRIGIQGLGESHKYHLRAYSAFNKFNGLNLTRCPDRFKAQDFPCLAVASTDPRPINVPDAEIRFLYCFSDSDNRKRIFTPRVLEDSVDFTKIAQLLEHCQENHKHLCCKSYPLVIGMRLIDCYTQANYISELDVVPASSCSTSQEYVALSYVWGKSDDEGKDDSSTSTDHDQLPKVVIDAMTVTTRLGYRYLWVDRYCIDQFNHREKDYQMNRMNLIYRGAEITVTAAAGTDAKSGLAGVGGTSRIPQHSLRIGNVSIVSSMHVPRCSIENSTWWTRAWTYQEGILSRRRLVFTEHEVYFECMAMHCRESWDMNLHELHSHGRFRFFIHAGLFSGSTAKMSKVPRSRFRNLENFRNMIAAFSTKVFSKDYGEKDSLRALAGVVNDFETRESPVFQWWGIPFLHAPDNPLESIKTFVMSLLWRHHPTNLSLKSNRPQRRSNFPSWSWAGWAGAVKFLPAHSTTKFSFGIDKISLELIGGHRTEIELSTIVGNCKLQGPEYGNLRALRFKALTLVPNELQFTISFGANYRTDPPPVCIRNFRATISLSGGGIKRRVSFAKLFSSGKNAFVFLAQSAHRLANKTNAIATRDEAEGSDEAMANHSGFKTEDYLHFLITQPQGRSSVRIGTMAVRADLESFKKQFQFVEREIRLI